MQFDTYYRALKGNDRNRYADRAGTSRAYIESHLLPRKKIPRSGLMERLAAASGGDVSYRDVVLYFMFDGECQG